MHVLIAGSSGMIGTAVTAALTERGDTVTTLVRRPPSGPGEISWDAARGQLDAAALEGVHAVIGLSGSPVSQLPWTKATRARILESRVSATRSLAAAIAASQASGNGPTTFISASGVNAYGNSRSGEVLTEDSPRPADGGFLCDVVQAWESAAAAAVEAGARVAFLRTGIVTGRGGAIDRIEQLARVGLAGPLGSGTATWPWISLRDEVRAILHILDSDLAGPVNLVGPVQATSGEVVRAVASRLRRPYWLPAPRWALKAALGPAADDLLLVDLSVRPQKLLDSGFHFSDTTIESALSER